MFFSTGSCRSVYSSKSFLFSLYNINGYAPVKVIIRSTLQATAIPTLVVATPTLSPMGTRHITVKGDHACQSKQYEYIYGCCFVVSHGKVF